MRTNKIESEKEGEFLHALPYKYYLLYCVGCETGLRISDILEMKRSDLMLREFEIIERKTGKKRLVKIPDMLRKKVVEYTKCVGINEYVFSSSRSRSGHLSRQAVYRAFKKAARFAGTKRNIGTHSMRKRYAGEMLRSGESLLEMQKALNHSHLSDTVLYLLDDVQELKEENKRKK